MEVDLGNTVKKSSKRVRVQLEILSARVYKTSIFWEKGECNNADTVRFWDKGPVGNCSKHLEVCLQLLRIIMKAGNLPVGKVFFSLALVLVKLPSTWKTFSTTCKQFHARGSLLNDLSPTCIRKKSPRQPPFQVQGIRLTPEHFLP